MMETLLSLLSEIGEAGWIVAALFGLGYWNERKSRDKMVEKFIELHEAALTAIHNNTTVLNTIKELAGGK